MTEQRANGPIGMFDSGVGGISVLREAVRQLPHEHFIFYGDTLHAPYGTKDRQTVLALTRRATERLLDMGVKALVIACNTATSAAAAALREEYPDLPIIGIEPALKPAAALHRDGVILSLATPGTLAGEKYRRLLSQYGAGVVSLPCPGLMELVEKMELDSPALHAYLDALFAPYQGQKVEAVVLGCTHYSFLKRAIARHFPQTPLLDGNAGTARQLRRRLAEKGLLSERSERGKIHLCSSGGEAAARQMRMLLEEPD